MAYPILRPGAKSAEVILAKKLTVTHLKAYKKFVAASRINVDTKTYGPRAVEGIKILQKIEGLVADGVIGPQTWNFLQKAAIKGPSVHKPSIQFDYRKKGLTHGVLDADLVVLHSTEGHDYPGVKDVEGVFNYLHGHKDQLNVHLVVDKDGNSGQGADFNKLCFHVMGANTRAIGIEQVGFARFSALAWQTRQAQLDKVAKWLAYLHKAYGIPLVHSTKHGVCLHREIHSASGHTDPGRFYPLGKVLLKAQYYAEHGW